MAYPTEDDIYERICWSADVPDLETVTTTVKRMPRLKRLKADRFFLDANGLDCIEAITELGVDVFDDAKGTEIPTKLAAWARVHCQHRPWMLNCMAGSVSGGPLTSDNRDEIEGLKQFADVCHEFGVRPCAVTVLTSKTSEMVQQEFGKTAEEQVLFYVEVLLNCGFTDVVCSPLEVSLIRSDSRFDNLSLDTPGIKWRPGGNVDQARTNNPAGAFHAGSDMLVIGRDITNGDPAKNLDGIVAEVLAAA